MTVLTIVLLVGAVIRLTRLITSDLLLEPLRCWVERRAGIRVGYMVRCDWCISVWVAFVVFVAGWYAPDTFVLLVSGALFASLITGWTSFAYDAAEMKVYGDD